MPPQPHSRPATKKLIMKFRSICKERGYNLKKTLEIMNTHYLKGSRPIKLSVVNKWYSDRPGICLNSETTLALKAFVADDGMPKELSTK